MSARKAAKTRAPAQEAAASPATASGSALAITAHDGGARFAVHVKPRASKSQVLGPKDGALELAVAAPPVDGAANAAVCALLAEALGTAKRNVQIVKGDTSRTKLVLVREVAPAEIARRLGGEARS